MNKNLFLGLDFGALFLKAVLLEKKRDKFKLLNFCLIAKNQSLSEGNPREGELEALKECLKKLELKSQPQVYFTFSSLSMAVRYLTFPKMSAGELKEALEWKLKNIVPFDLNEAATHFWTKPSVFSADETEVVFLAVLKQLLEEKMTLFQNVGLKAAGFSPAPLPLAEAYKEVFKNFADEAIVLVDLGHLTTNIALVFKGEPKFSRVISTGVYHFEEALKTVFVSDIGAVKFSDKECQEILYEEGIHEEEAEKKYKVVSCQQINALLRPILERLEGEIKRSTDYFKQNFGQTTIKKMFFSGGGAAIKNLENQLAKKLGLELIKLSSLDWLIVSEDIFAEQNKGIFFRQFGPVLGLIKSAGKITFLPFQKKEKQRFSVDTYFKMVIPILAGVVLVISLLIFRVNLNYTGNVKIINQKIGELDWVTQYFEKMEKAPAGSKVPFLLFEVSRIGKIFKFLGNSLPDEIVLTELTLADSGKSLIMKGFIFWGRVSPEETLANFMLALKDSQIFGEPRLIKETVRADIETKPIEFELEVTKSS